MKKKIIASLLVLCISALLLPVFACGTRANWAAQKKDSKANEVNLREANGSEKYIIYAAMTITGDEENEKEELIEASDFSSETSSYAVVGYTGLVSELIVPDEFAPNGEESKPVTQILAVDPYSDYRCYMNGVRYTGESALLQNNTVVTTLSLGSNMTYVGAGVCAGMTNLYDVIFERSGESVEIGQYAFAACPNLSRLTYSRTENYIEFGSYPQTKVTDEAIISALNTMAGTLPENGSDRAWTAYHYASFDYMWYIDLTYNNEKYRGVYFDQYRPQYPSATLNESMSFQDDNGYYINTVYWFQFEPIRWRILATESENLFLMADRILDGQRYGNSYKTYRESSIRKWLNEDFYECAFNSIQKSMILTTNVKNDLNSAIPTTGSTDFFRESNNYLCEDTPDKVFLLSVRELTTTQYGFAASPETNDKMRGRRRTDYAKSQGAQVDSYYWSRTPKYDGISAHAVHYNCNLLIQPGVVRTNLGVVPALWIRQS